MLKKFLGRKEDFLNITSLGLIQFSNAVFPILIFPYLYVTLDTETFSRIVVSEAVILYLLVFCIYSFDVSGVRDIARKDKITCKIDIQNTYFLILYSRLAILFCSSLLILPVFYIFFNDFFLFVTIWLMWPLGMILQSNYFYIATEKNHILALIIILTRIISGTGILLFAGKDNPILAVVLVSSSFLISGLISFSYLFTRLGFKFISNLSQIYSEVMNGWNIFLGNFSVSLFRGSNLIVLQLVSNEYSVATYAIAEKLIRSIQSISRPLSEFSFAKLSKIFKTDISIGSFKTHIWKYTYPQMLIMFGLTCLILISSYAAITFQLIEGFSYYLFWLVALMSPAIIFGIGNYMFGLAGLNIMNSSKEYSRYILSTGLITLTLSFFLSYFYGSLGAGMSFVFGEILLFFYFYNFYLNKERNLDN